MTPPQIAGWLLIIVAASSPVRAVPVGGDTSFEQFAKAEVTRVTKTDGFSGTILVTRGDKVLLRRAEGFADPSKSVPNRVGTLFPLESLSKQFTATAILLLIKDHKIALDDPIGNYYANLPPTLAAVTIKQLLTHSAGIVDCNPCKINSYRDYIDLSTLNPLAFQPGKGMLYSNAGYGLLAAAIERVTGQTYAQFIEANIFKPLHMTHSGSGSLPPNSAQGYIQNADDPALRLGQPPYLEHHEGFGSLFSTVDDMQLWVRALQNGALLAHELHDAMLTDYGHEYGFGIRISKKFGRSLIWHTGADARAGYGTIEDIFPKEGLAVIVLFNNSGLSKNQATLEIEGKKTSFKATAARELVQNLESEYFTGNLPQ